MNQRSLFDDEAPPSGTVVPVGIPGSAPALGKAQRLFNTLIAKIEAQRARLREWEDFVPAYQQRCHADLEPIQARLADRRRAMVLLLDRAYDGPALTKRECAKVRDLLLALLADLLGDDGSDEALVRLYDKHSDVSFEEERQQSVRYVEAMASQVFGVDLGDDHGARTAEELAALVGERILADEEARAAAPASPPRPQTAKAAAKAAAKAEKAAAKEAQRDRARQEATRSLREVYRRLASDLHPDREPDPDERTRKTALMQKVNEAYEARNLLALLELQLAVEQIDGAGLAALGEERLAHYNHVLQEQLERLQDELDDLVEPFRVMLRARNVTPGAVLGALDADVRELRSAVKEIDADLAAFTDARVLKARLKSYRIGDAAGDDIELAMLDELIAAAPARGRSRKR